MKAHFNPTIVVTLVVLACPEIAMATASTAQTHGAALKANIPASALSPTATPTQQSGAATDATRRAQLMKLFDASFHDRQQRMDHCIGAENVGPPQPYRWATVERWWENQSNFQPRDRSGSGFETRVVQNQSFSTYLYCLQRPPH
ncbi:MAG: hypothetical protein ACRER1_08260 [Gammaproteobacteria bacterium]